MRKKKKKTSESFDGNAAQDGWWRVSIDLVNHIKLLSQ